VAAYHCEDGATLSGDKCIAASLATIADYTCPETYDLRGSQCAGNHGSAQS
jgi:hypothetical protein